MEQTHKMLMYEHLTVTCNKCGNDSKLWSFSSVVSAKCCLGSSMQECSEHLNTADRYPDAVTHSKWNAQRSGQSSNFKQAPITMYHKYFLHKYTYHIMYNYRICSNRGPCLYFFPEIFDPSSIQARFLLKLPDFCLIPSSSSI